MPPEMILEHTEDNLTMRYDFEEERLSLIINNKEDGSQTQVNIGIAGIATLSELIEIVINSKNMNWNKIKDKSKI